MLLKTAREIGRVCGLLTWEESVRNIVLHATMLFAYCDIERELTELKLDCSEEGLNYDKAFDTVCVSALNKQTRKIVYFLPNVPNNPADIAKAISRVESKGCDAQVEV